MKIPVTPIGLKRLKEQLSAFKAERPVVADQIEEARAHGDLSENADYDAAKEKSGILEAKIRDLEAKISSADTIDPSKISSYEKIVFGACVEYEDMDSGQTKKINILGPAESDTSKGIISIDTPLARALVGKKTGDVVEIRLPAGQREYEILSVSAITVDY